MMVEHQGLPVELLSGIFDKLHEDNPLSLVPLTLVCRQFYMLVIPLLYRNITIDIGKRDASRKEHVHETLVERLLNGPTVCAFVKELRVVGRKGYNGIWDDSFEPLPSLLPRLTRLEVVRWEVKAFLPEASFELLLENASNKRLRLHLDVGVAFELENMRTCDTFLVHASHALCSLRIWIPYCYYRTTETRDIKSRIFNTLKHCPNLRSFAIYGNSSMDHATDGVRLAVEPGDTLPPLQELSIIGDSTITIFQREDLEIWGANGGWSNLQRVTFRDHQLLDGIHGCQDTLDSINLTHVSEGFEQSLGRICSRVDNLRELRVGGERSCVPIAALQRCGHSLKSLVVLRSLVLRGHNFYGVDQVNEVGLEGLQLIQDHCPLVSSMALSIDRQPDRPLQDHLSILARFDCLEELSIDFGRYPKSRDSHWSQIKEAEMGNVQNLFRYLIKHKRGRKLKSLKIYCGTHLSDWDHRADIKDDSDFFHATTAPGVGGQDPEIFVRHIRHGEIQGIRETEIFPCDNGSVVDEANMKSIDYLNSMPPTTLSRMITDLSRQANKASAERLDFDYNVRTGGLQSSLVSYEADWRMSNGMLPLLEWQLRKRKEQGWDLWEMPLMQGKAGKEGFVYDRLRACEESSKIADAPCNGEIKGRKETLPAGGGHTSLDLSITKRKPRACSI